LLSIKEMEVRRISFAETWPPGEIDFSDAGVLQAAPLKAEGVAELLRTPAKRFASTAKWRPRSIPV